MRKRGARPIVKARRGFGYVTPKGKLSLDILGTREAAQSAAAFAHKGKLSIMWPTDWHIARNLGWRVVPVRVEPVERYQPSSLRHL